MPTALTVRGNHRSSKQLRASGCGPGRCMGRGKILTLQSGKVTSSGCANTCSGHAGVKQNSTASVGWRALEVRRCSANFGEKGVAMAAPASAVPCQRRRRLGAAMTCFASKATHEWLGSSEARPGDCRHISSSTQ